MNIPFTTDHITMQNLLNCYIKETGKGEWKAATQIELPFEKKYEYVLIIPFADFSVTLYIPVRYKSETGRHLFAPNMYYQDRNEEVQQLDFLTLLSYMQKDLAKMTAKPVQTEELLLRTILSYQTMKGILSHRSDDLTECYQAEKTFLQSEQSLLIGHQVHPTPKSRQGIDDEEEHIFAPERKGSFQIHYFRVKHELVEEDSVLSQTATMLIKEELSRDPFVSESFKELYCQQDDWSLIPVHPLQARKLLGKQSVHNQIEAGKLVYLGPKGREYYPTASIRTVYHQDAAYMYKFSIPVKITNSLRVNKRKELDRGVEVSRLLRQEIMDSLNELYPSFKVIEDPAYITVNLDMEEESGFETVVRDNPFQAENAQRTTLLAGLSQDHVEGGKSHLANVIHQLAERKQLSIEEASEQWFRRYLNITLRPLYWIYTTYGIALEAHQQNSVVQLDENGLPAAFFYRDNQGYYFMDSKAQWLKQVVPNLNEKSDTICTDSIAEERFRYYFFFNHIFGLINAFGVSHLIEEHRLLKLLKEELHALFKQFGDSTNLISSLLNEETLPCKANLLTRVHDMDELVGSLETQSVYTSVENPLYKTAGELYEV
ncbi:IucA/IucC family protein [Virgibacillus ihumii]|uniref:IucA/IucC family protein n=1 Tax=Virgibacillus ihumii TaxID=2686091 RepID=UPI00157CDD72|nr:IucA/IucC family siderophore biosynthesis protein [Virgibacillus ihumii]